jgi:hypothetical protein
MKQTKPKRKDNNSGVDNIFRGWGWEATVLGHMESVNALIVILMLVVGATIMSTLEFALNLKYSEDIARIDFVVSMIFICELCVRMYCYAMVHHELNSFVKSPLNSLDIFVVLLDIVLLSLDTQFLQGATSFAKSLK